MSSYNLTDNVNEEFEFTISGSVYKMRYPLVEELEKLQEIAKRNKDLEDAGQEFDEKELEDYIYTFITPVQSDSPPIGQVMKKQNLKVLQNFNKMFKTEFGIQ